MSNLICFYICTKTYTVGACLNCLTQTIPIVSTNSCFCAKITKVIVWFLPLSGAIDTDRKKKILMTYDNHKGLYYHYDLVFYMPFNIIKSYWDDGTVIMKDSGLWSAKQSWAEFHLWWDSNQRPYDLKLGALTTQPSRCFKGLDQLAHQ